MRRLRELRMTRDRLIFGGGFFGVFYEAVTTQADRPFLLGVFATMMGLPSLLGLDETRNRKQKDEDSKRDKPRHLSGDGS